MKKYIAFAQGNACNSGPKFQDEAEKWAAKTLADRPNVESVTITEIIGEYRRTTPIVRFVAAPADEPDCEEKPRLIA